MTAPQGDSSARPQPIEPTRRERLRPLELLGFAAVLAVFAYGVVGVTTRTWLGLAAIVGVLAFIVSLVMLALVGLATKPNAEDIAARQDLSDPNGHTH